MVQNSDPSPDSDPFVYEYTGNKSRRYGIRNDDIDEYRIYDSKKEKNINLSVCKDNK